MIDLLTIIIYLLSKLLKTTDGDCMEESTEIINKTLDMMELKLPKLRSFAKQLRKQCSLDYLLDVISDDSYKGRMIKGILIGEYKDMTYEQLRKYIEYYVPKITDWALCDTFCCSIKQVKNYRSQIWQLIQKYLKSTAEFDVRFGLVMIINYFIDKEHLTQIFDIINSATLDKYYVKMANAWLISFVAAKYFDECFDFLQNKCVVDEWTFNKGIQKSIESYRISSEQKNALRALKK